MDKKREAAIPVSVSEEDAKALLSMLNLIAESDDSIDQRDGKIAAKIRDSIIQYRKPCRKKTGKGYIIYFLESEAAMMIKYFAMTVRLIMQPEEDRAEQQNSQ